MHRSLVLSFICTLIMVNWIPPAPVSSTVTACPVQERASFAEELLKIIDAEGWEAAQAIATKMVAEVGAWRVDEAEINRVAYGLLRQRKPHEAEIFFRANVALFPQSWNAWDSLGELLMVTRRSAEGKEAYRRSLELNPDNNNGRRMLNFAGFEAIDRERETKLARALDVGIVPDSQGPWFGMRLPGSRGEVFAPGIVSVAASFDFAITFTPECDECYFTSRSDSSGLNTIMVSRRTSSGWTVPEVAPFSGKYFDFEPHIAPDGSFMLFGSQRPVPGSRAPNENTPILMMKRRGSGWAEPVLLGPGMFATTSRNGSVYLTDIEGSAHGIVSWKLAEERPAIPQREGGGVNNPAPGVPPCIAPDESFIIFDSIRADGVGGPGASDLYICFRQEDGGWGPAINLGPDINTPGENICAALSPDGKFLFYTAHRDIWWVSMDAVLRLRTR